MPLVSITQHPQGTTRIKRPQRNEPLRAILKCIAGPVLLSFFSLQTEGKEHLPRKSAFILLPKHQCWQDIPLTAMATPRPLYYIAKHELFQNPISDRFMRSLGGIPLNRHNPLKSREDLRAMVQYLRAGEGIVVFPEGTYYPGKMGPGKVGILRLITARFSLPLIPAGIRYGERGARTLVKIRFGEPIFPEKSRKPNQTLHMVMEQIARLSGFA
ncbi:MAG: lysophospholipid acyltransferase family protein [Deltaproteobacteria bacterium]|nr:lysophospholipid acyltransferase family protein [Deltaproteobacteria bacterium]